MQTKTKRFMAAGLAAVLAAGGLAGLASAHMKQHGRDGGMGGGMDRGADRGMSSQQMMDRYDANKDGKITQAEIDQNRAQWYGDFDADKNGGLTLQEFTNLWLKARAEMIVREFQFFDRDGNGMVTIEEYQAPLRSVVADQDRNGDGVLSVDDRRMRLRHGNGPGPKDGGPDGDGTDQGPPPAGSANP